LNRDAAAIAGRLSLRAPQREALELLAAVAELLPLRKDQDVAASLARIGAAYPTVQEFERNFPSICFALATGVGKTRLMGAFIAWLRRARGIRHFFVLAPNLTIYNKLIADFTPHRAKYVFQGLADFAVNPPVLITGDNWDQGQAVQYELQDTVQINLFNISKINTEVRGGSSPRVKRLNEVLGESYFEYLSRLPDLVLLMDESHRYRAAAGMQAINELKPVLGLELTATPQIERGARPAVPFRNVIYSYPLAHALRDGFVKEPAVATRENFDAAAYSEEQLEQLKLEDGVRVHEAVKAELSAYSVREARSLVKPFMLVVTQDTTHAAAIEARIKADNFFGGQYRDKVITVHSTLRGEEKEENVERLLRVEDPGEPTEIVIHVNMLKEGWDVTNLYTIVPLRAATSRTLVEQSIGRGLRLPYGKRTGVDSVDRLTIIAHDKFQEIIDEANRPDSAIRYVPVYIGNESSLPVDRVAVTVPAPAEAMFTAAPAVEGAPAPLPPAFTSTEDQRVARVAIEVVQQFFGHHASPLQVLEGDHRKKFLVTVREALISGQGELELRSAQEIDAVTVRAVEELALRTIDIPRIIVVPTGEVRTGFRDFDLDVSAIRFQPVENDILIQHLSDHQRETLAGGGSSVDEPRRENFVVRSLVSRPDVSYDDHAALLYKLAGQVVRHLRSYLPDEAAVKNVLQFQEERIGGLVHAQLAQHAWEEAVGYEARVSRGFERLPPQASTADRSEPVRDVRRPVAPLSRIGSMRFGWFRKSIYREARFDSDAERRMAVLLDDAREVEKWARLAGPPPRIDWGHGASYEPDFIAEATDYKYLIEVKAANEMEDADVQAKAQAAGTWCRHASEFARQQGTKPWTYLLIPHDEVSAAATLQGLVARFALR
jgi:type III restriction enzyme